MAVNEEEYGPRAYRKSVCSCCKWGVHKEPNIVGMLEEEKSKERQKNSQYFKIVKEVLITVGTSLAVGAALAAAYASYHSNTDQTRKTDIPASLTGKLR